MWILIFSEIMYASECIRFQSMADYATVAGSKVNSSCATSEFCYFSVYEPSEQMDIMMACRPASGALQSDAV